MCHFILGLHERENLDLLKWYVNFINRNKTFQNISKFLFF